MKKNIRQSVSVSSIPNPAYCFEGLEQLVRERVQAFVQDIIDEEASAFLGRARYQRKSDQVDTPHGYRNGHGKPRRLAMMGGTIAVRRPRVRGTLDKFESKILPLFRRRTKELGDLLPELYLHGLARGDFERALRGLLGDGGPALAIVD